MAQRLQRPMQPLHQDDDDDDDEPTLPLCVRYPNKPWIVFDDNKYTQHQKKGLEMFIASGKDTLDVSIPHPVGGQYEVEFGKNITINEETNKELILYYYIKTNLETVQMMYAAPEYIAYINRLTT